MNNSQIIAATIKNRAKSQGVSIGTMLEKCEMSKNALSSMQSGGFMPRLENICKIADYLNCSVDYLLGRTDIPNVSEKYTNRDGIQAIRNGSVIINTIDNEIMSEFASMFQALTTENKIRVMHYALELKGETKNEPNKEV